MATFSTLPSELLAHILRLSTEDERPEEQQRSRFSFGLVARACHLATADAGTFVVAGDRQAIALALKLERERKWVAQAERQATSGTRWTTRSALVASRASNVSRLSCVFETKESDKVLARLIRSTPNLIGLTLARGGAQQKVLPKALRQLEVALGGLRGLRELSLDGDYAISALCGLLMPLQTLEVLDLELANCCTFTPGVIDNSLTLLAARPPLPRLRELRICLRCFSPNYPVAPINALFSVLVGGSRPSLQTLHLPRAAFSPILPPDILAAILPHLTNFSWTPNHTTLQIANITYGPSRSDLTVVEGEAILACIRPMSSLQTLSLPMWTIDHIIDHSLLDTLSTLPCLHTVVLSAAVGVLDEGPVVNFIQAAPALYTLDLHLGAPWTAEQKELVRVAGEEAGVTIRYT